MVKRWLRLRWLTVGVVLVLVGFGVFYFAGSGVGSSSAAGPAKKGGPTAARIEKLHQRTAVRTKGDDPDDRPAFLSPEQAVEIATKAVQAKQGQQGQQGQAGAAPVAGGSSADAGVHKIDHKAVQGTAVFAVVVGTTEVDVDRQTGKVVAMHEAGQ